MNNFDVEIAHSVEDVGQEIWDSLAQDKPFASYRWYHFCEKIYPECKPVYLLLFQDGRLKSRATFLLQGEVALPVSNKLIESILYSFTKVVLHRWPLMVCLTPLVNLPGIILPDDPTLASEALETITDAAKNYALKNNVSFLVFDYLSPVEINWSGWSNEYIEYEYSLNPGTRLDIIWPNFEDYVSSFSRRRRKNYKLNANHATKCGIKISTHSEVTTNLAQADALMRNVEIRYNEKVSPVERRLLKYAHMVDSTWFTAEIEGKLMGCELFLRDGTGCMVRSLGLDYSEKYVYFALTYADIRYAIEQGVKVYYGDYGAYDAKQGLGFEVLDNKYLLYTACHSVFRWVAGLLD